MKQSIEDTIESVLHSIELESNTINYELRCSKMYKSTIKWGVERIMNIISVELNPIISKLKEIQK